MHCISFVRATHRLLTQTVLCDFMCIDYISLDGIFSHKKKTNEDKIKDSHNFVRELCQYLQILRI